jgi:NADH dehydrogenase
VTRKRGKKQEHIHMKDQEAFPRVVIIGAGFAGLSMAKSFKDTAVEVLLIDQNNYHNFQPLMYQVATGGLQPDSIAYPVRRVFRNYDHVRFRMAQVSRVDAADKTIHTPAGTIPFDYLIIATGSTNNYFDFEDVKDKLLTLKSIPDALNLRSYIFQNLERAISQDAADSKEALLNIAIVGGGPAGIELAGALAEMKRFVLPRDFPDLDFSKMTINLYEAAPKLLVSMSTNASEKSEQFLKELGVIVHTNSIVTSYDGSTVKLKDGTSFTTKTVIWTAGVKGAPIDGLPPASIVAGNRIAVDSFNQVLETSHIYAVGDVASHVTEHEPKGLPMLAPVAQQQGAHLALNIVKLTKGETMKPFHYSDKGTMATIGRRRAVVDLPQYKFSGTFAWLIWMFLHIFSLIGFRNKIVAFIDWLTNYLSYDRPLGLIIRPFRRKE